MPTLYGTNADNIFPFSGAPSGSFVIDGLAGIDAIDFGTTKRSDYTFTLLPDGGVQVDSISGASYTLKGLLYNFELLYFDGRRDTLDLRTFFSVTLDGTSLADNLVGTTGADSVRAGAGHDFITGKGGNDTINGGAGIDLAIYSGNASSYSLGFDVSTGGWSVSDSVPARDGQDRLIEVERVQFADRTVILDARAHAGFADLPRSMYQFFILAFDAAPGVEYLQQCADAYRGMVAGLSGDALTQASAAAVRTITNVFTSKSQFTDVYATSLSNRALAEKLIENVVGTSAAAATKAQAVNDITAAMDNGLSVGNMIYTVFSNLAAKPLSGNEWSGTARLFQNQIAVAQYYTEVMNQSTTDLATLRAAISAVTSMSEVGTPEAIVSLVGQGLLGG